MNRSESEPDALLEFDRQPAVACVETDCFCDGCGYNLRTQPVRREARTDLLLCRCPECGRFQPARDGATAGHVWLQRLGTLALFLWILVILSAGFGVAAGQVGLTFVPLEELTTYHQVPVVPLTTQPAAGTVPTSQTSTTTVIRAGQITITMPGGGSTTTVWRRQIRERDEYDGLFIALMRGSSFAMGFVLAMLAAVFFHHWHRWCYVIPVVLVSVGAGVLVWCIWRAGQPHLLEWATPHIIAQAAAHFVGGLAGILFGRPLARLIVTLVLPPRVRQVLAFLWLADGKRPPAPATTS